MKKSSSRALAVIQSIVALTPADDSGAFADSVKGRIRAMAAAHNLLSESRWRGADLLSLMQEELAPYQREGRVQVDGLPVSILPTVAQNLALVLHELATNAAKYGALSEAEGQLSVSWRIADNKLCVDWSETCQRPIAAPTKKGFGSKVIEASINAQLGGRIEHDWRANGLRCTFSLPMTHFSTREPRGAAPNEAAKREIDRGCVRGRNILVVEDEPLIAMMTGRVVKELGAAVLGPFSAPREAQAVLATPIDAALLDVNVGGEFVYALAEQLVARGVPIVFVTGYDARAVDPRFAASPVLTKPVDREELTAALARVFAPPESTVLHA